jgi:hypothetical protein
MDFSLPIISALIGVIVLFFGRKLFWLCVAALGFAAGVELAPYFVHEPSAVLQLTIALVLGFVGALLAILLQKLAVGIVGFAAGGRLAVGLATMFFVDSVDYYWLIFIIGGIIGAILLLSLFDWALIFISSLIGAHLILRAITLPTTGEAVAFIILTAIGVIAQAGMFRRQRDVVA